MKADIEKSFQHLGNKIDIILRHNPAAKKMRLRIDTKTGKGLVVMPKYCTMKKAMEFAKANASWLAAKINAAKPQIILADGHTVNILGENLLIKYQNRLRGVTSRREKEIQVYGDPEMVRNRVVDFIKDAVRRHVTMVAEKYSALLGVSFSQIHVKDTSSRWGSCNSKGEISICWKLAFAPVPVFDYIVIHETVHLKHFDHSDKFWKTVGRFFPDYEKAQRWLKHNGSLLQNIG